MYGIGNDPFGPQDQGGLTVGDQWVGRVMSAEYNLAFQRRDPIQAGIIAGAMFGEWLQTRFGGGQ